MDAMTIYLKDLWRISRSYPQLTKEEEIRLCSIANNKRLSKIRREIARKTMILSNLRLVIRPACKVNMIDRMDAIQAGFFGLDKAVRRFDGSKSRFSTYATFNIRMAIQEECLNTCSTVRVPITLHHAKKNETDDEKKCRALGRQALTPTSNAIEDIEQHDTPTHFSLEDTESLAAIQRAMQCLPERERKVIAMRFGLCGYNAMILQEISDAIGVTRERVRQIQCAAIAHIQAILKVQ